MIIMKKPLSFVSVQEFFNRLAPRYDEYQDRNRYYHRLLANIHLSCIPLHSSVIDFGCGTGRLLSLLSPSRGCGIDFSSEMVSLAKKRLKDGAQFFCEPFETFSHQERFDYAIISNTLEYVNDIDLLLIKAHELLNEDGKVIVTTVNPVWKPIVRLANALHLKTPDIEKNFLTNKDVVNLLETAGFEIIEEGVSASIPLYFPCIVPFLNCLLRELPLVRQTGLIQHVIAKKKRAARDYHCSVIVPCYNEAENVGMIIREMPQLGLSTEVIFVDDGSKDGTAARVSAGARADIAVRCVSYQPNRGKRHAVWEGFKAAQGEVLFILDADGTVPPQELKKCYRILAQGQADFINATRTIYPMEEKAMNIIHYVGNKLFCLLVNFIIGQRITDTLCGTKGFFKKNLTHFSLGLDPWGDYDFIFGAAHLRLKIRDVAIHYRERRFGRSKMRALKQAAFLLASCWWGVWQMKIPFVSMRKAQFSR